MKTIPRLVLTITLWFATLSTGTNAFASEFVGYPVGPHSPLTAEQIQFRVAGPPNAEHVVLLLHGVYSHGGTWKPLLDELETQSVLSITPNSRGFGETPRAGDNFSPQVLADDIEVLLQRLDETIAGRKVHVVGHSLGGRTAIAFAARYPQRVASVTVIDLSLGRSQKIVEKICAKKVAGKEPSIDDIYVAHSWEVDLYPALSSLTVPILFLSGERQSGGFLAKKDWRRAESANPLVRVQVYRKAGHDLHRKLAKPVARQLTQFWKSTVSP